MNFEKIKADLKKVVESQIGENIVILNHPCDNRIREFLETFPLARRINSIVESTLTEIFKENGKSKSGIEELRSRCTPTSGSRFDFDSHEFSTLYTVDYCYIPEDIEAAKFLAESFGKNYISVIDAGARTNLPKEILGFEIWNYDN